jgi:acyl-coenzyme A synthetase/AMP-(fatty) acid ligase
VIVDKHFLSYATSLELPIPTVLFEDIPTFGSESDIEAFDFDELSDEERKAERNNPSFYLHTSGSTGHPKLIGQVCHG